MLWLGSTVLRRFWFLSLLFSVGAWVWEEFKRVLVDREDGDTITETNGREMSAVLIKLMFIEGPSEAECWDGVCKRWDHAQGPPPPSQTGR